MVFVWTIIAIFCQFADVVTATATTTTSGNVSSLVLPNATHVTITLTLPENASNTGLSNATIGSGTNFAIKVPQAAVLKIETPMYAPLLIPIEESVELTLVVPSDTVATLIVLSHNATTTTTTTTTTTFMNTTTTTTFMNTTTTTTAAGTLMNTMNTTNTTTSMNTTTTTTAAGTLMNTMSVVSGEVSVAGQFEDTVLIETYCSGVREGFAVMLNTSVDAIQLSNCRFGARRLSEEGESMERRLAMVASLSTEYAVTTQDGQSTEDNSVLNTDTVANTFTVMSDPASEAFTSFSSGFVASVEQNDPNVPIDVTGATSTVTVQPMSTTTSTTISTTGASATSTPTPTTPPASSTSTTSASMPAPTPAPSTTTSTPTPTTPMPAPTRAPTALDDGDEDSAINSQFSLGVVVPLLLCLWH